VIADVLMRLRAQSGCSFARMSGSGATCFAIFAETAQAEAAADAVLALHPDWWVAACSIKLPR
jgi:4-diphosphocytidyl-2-C-methyl-D-erythritol kinase